LQPTSIPHVISLRYDGTCSVCETSLVRRTRAWWYRDEKKIVCTACRPEDTTVDAPVSAEAIVEAAEIQDAESSESRTPVVSDEAVRVVAPLIVDGEAGASARREGERRRAKRERETLARHPRLGKLILAVSDEPQSVRSWGKGAVGEEALGAKLHTFATERIVVLHDRKIPGSRANIDHLVIAPGGVFVIDAKHYSGKVEKRNLGNIFRSDIRLYVGRRECTKLLHGSEDQAEIVRDALLPLGFTNIPVRPVLCFVGAEWGLFPSAFKLGSVLVTFPKFLYELIAKSAEVETEAIQETAKHLVAALPRA
jgi:Nuclease-related domain